MMMISGTVKQTDITCNRIFPFVIAQSLTIVLYCQYKVMRIKVKVERGLGIIRMLKYHTVNII